MNTTAVIGANFGDEGKGLMTDYFSDSKTVVVRHNGGSQAGHTVVTPSGVRHVFNHFGSGTLAGAATFLGPLFIINPLIWKKELGVLKKLGFDPKVFYCGGMVTTPYDMLINEEVERSRGNKRHGSCGLGINETVTRCHSEKFAYPSLRIDSHCNCLTRDKIIRVVRDIRDRYCRARIDELGLSPNKQFFNIFESEALLERYVNEVCEFSAHCIEINLDEQGLRTMGIHLGGEIHNFVFESGQGLLLDEEHEFFPHVTRSKTGLRNILDICKKFEIPEIDVTYVTRAYMTRHGAGPFPSEDKDMRYEDKTNVTNEFQGGLRFGALDIDLMSKAIKNDLTYASVCYFEHTAWNPIKVNPSLAITCLDQVGDKIKIHGEKTGINVDDLTSIISKETGITNFYTSHGPTREKIAPLVLVG